jgi:very-short-patch-repair endonuclease
MIFVLSKPPEEFKGTIGQALMHFRRLLTERTMAEEGDTDPNSPMERKLLGWLKATSFLQQELERIELMAQFPIGEYLRQLDPTYRHPAYKTDFLLRYLGDKMVSVVIEYDGFEHHFVSKEKVNAATFERYYKPEDVERQFVLESYGYRFLRVNRFNLGDDPVATLDGMLREIVELTGDRGEEVSTVSKIKAQAQALGEKAAKLCSKCKAVKDLSAFFDPALGGGKGSHGRVCMNCKSEAKQAVASPTVSSSPYRRRW